MDHQTVSTMETKQSHQGLMQAALSRVLLRLAELRNRLPLGNSHSDQMLADDLAQLQLAAQIMDLLIDDTDFDSDPAGYATLSLWIKREKLEEYYTLKRDTSPNGRIQLLSFLIRAARAE